MADQNSAPRTPFEWLQGGIFFGKSNKGGIESIDSCNDVLLLLKGISDDLESIVSTGEPKLEPEKSAEVNSEADTTASLTESAFLAARLSRLRFLLYDERRKTSQQPESRRIHAAIAGTTAQGLTGEQLQDLTPRLLENLRLLPFESRKHATAIFNYLLVCGLEGADAALYKPIMELFRDFVDANFERLMTIIVEGHDTSTHGAADVVLHYGSMYRSCLRHPSLYRQLVGSTERAQRFVFPFLDIYVHLPNFDMSSDAMECLRASLAANGDRVTQDEETAAEIASIAAEFLSRDYEEVWDKRFNLRLLSDTANYMTRRVALQILSTVLLSRSNYAIMIRYVESRTNLILIMQQLRDTSPHISLDAFHVFKVFVANPNKPPEVAKILRDNKAKLCAYLTTLHQDKEDTDAQLRDEKALIISTIDEL